MQILQPVLTVEGADWQVVGAPSHHEAVQYLNGSGLSDYIYAPTGNIPTANLMLGYQTPPTPIATLVALLYARVQSGSVDLTLMLHDGETFLNSGSLSINSTAYTLYSVPLVFPSRLCTNLRLEVLRGYAPDNLVYIAELGLALPEPNRSLLLGVW